MKLRCLYCYNLLSEGEVDFHASCAKKFFGQTVVPELPFSEQNIEELAQQIIRSQTTVTGVQPKLSLHLESASKQIKKQRFTIVGMWGEYILKPPTENYKELPEVEDITMHLASIARINTVPHSLIRMQSGKLAYITKRIDRSKKGKIHMEDMCQLTERLSEDKYQGSYEQIAKAILQYSVNPGLDVINFFELVLFSFLTGNADMHLKNFSLIHQKNTGPLLSPAYDLVATKLVNPADDEDLALTLNGKKKKIRRGDFDTAFNTLQLDRKQQQNIYRKMEKAYPKWVDFIKISFLSNEFKQHFLLLLGERMRRVYS